MEDAATALCHDFCEFRKIGGRTEGGLMAPLLTVKQTTIRIPLCPCSVPDPNSEILWPPGSGSVIICTDPDPDPPINKQKNKKNLDFYTFGTSSLSVW